MAGAEKQRRNQDCRFCGKLILAASLGSHAVPRADLFKPLKNKEFTSPLGVEAIVLQEIANELCRPGEEITPNDSSSSVCYLPCARSLVRAYSVIRKLFQARNQKNTGSKRQQIGSPGSPSSKISCKKPKTLSPSARKKLILNSDSDEQNKENLNVKPIAIRKQEDCSKLPGVTKIIVCSPGGKCTTYEYNGLEKTIARAIVFKNPRTLARAALKSPMWKYAIIEQVARLLTTESIEYFKKSNLLRMCKGRNPIDICNFQMKDLKKELWSDMPMTIRLMEAVAGLKSKKNDGDTVNHGANAVKKTRKQTRRQGKKISSLKEPDVSKSNAIANAVSILLKQHFPTMSALLYRNTLLMMNGGCRSLDVDRMNMQGVLMSHSSGVKMQNKMAKEFSNDVEQWRDDLAKKELMLRNLTEIPDIAESCGKELTVQNVKSIPSFDQNAWDNIQLEIQNKYREDPGEFLQSLAKVKKLMCDVKVSIEDYR